MISYPIKQSGTSQDLLFMLVSSSDHIAPVTGATPTVVLRKPGGSFATPSGAVAEIGNGWYKVAGNATDTNTLGPLILHATATGADPCDVLYPVVAFDPQAASNLGLSALPMANPAAPGGLPTVGTGSGQVNPSSGKVPATLASTDVAGNVAADLQTIKMQAVTCSGGVTVPAATLASTTNITTVGAVAGSVASVTAAVTLPPIPPNWITAAGIASSALNGKGDWLLDSGYTTPPTAAAVATAIWTDTASGDFSVSNSPGYAVKNGLPILLTQAVPTSNTPQTVGDSLNAARAQGFGKWTLVGTALTLYAGDGTTIVRTFTLDSATAPTQRF